LPAIVGWPYYSFFRRRYISKTLDGIVTAGMKGPAYFLDIRPGNDRTPILRIIPQDRLDEEPAYIGTIERGERVDHFETQRISKGRCVNKKYPFPYHPLGIKTGISSAPVRLPGISPIKKRQNVLSAKGKKGSRWNWKPLYRKGPRTG